MQGKWVVAIVGDVLRFNVSEDGKEFAHCYVWMTGTCAEVFDLWVDEEKRGQGVAKTLVDLAVSHCRACGVRVVQAHVDPENLPSSGVFSGRHFKMTGMEMHMEIRL